MNTETAEKNTAVFLRTVQYFVYSAVFLRTNDGVFSATSCNNYICGNSVSYVKSGCDYDSDISVFDVCE